MNNNNNPEIATSTEIKLPSAGPESVAAPVSIVTTTEKPMLEPVAPEGDVQATTVTTTTTRCAI